MNVIMGYLSTFAVLHFTFVVKVTPMSNKYSKTCIYDVSYICEM